MIRVWLTDLFKALLRVLPQVTGPYRAYQTTRSTGGFDLIKIYNEILIQSYVKLHTFDRSACIDLFFDIWYDSLRMKF